MLTVVTDRTGQGTMKLHNDFPNVLIQVWSCVVVSVWEIIGQADGGLSVLRTFRLLRVLKLVRFLPALRRQLVVLMKTMDNVATFCMLLMLFIFTFRYAQTCTHKHTLTILPEPFQSAKLFLKVLFFGLFSFTLISSP